MKTFIIFVLFSVLTAINCAWAAPSVENNKIENDASSSSRYGTAARYLGSCFEQDDTTTCLAVKGIVALNRAAKMNNIILTDGLSLKRDPESPVQRFGRAMIENDIYAELPENTEERQEHLTDMAVESAAEFLSTHNLEVKLPKETTQSLARALEEGRGKMKKILGPLIMAVGAKLFAVVPLVLGALALLTFKAVIVAKIALVLALILSGSRLLSGLGNKSDGGLGGAYNSAGSWAGPVNSGWNAAASSSYPYARSIDSPMDIDDNKAQELAYSGQINNVPH
uniref:Osiris 14 n=1 Tax=Glossina palpalis gambiensis TaxID=67801 RepID=A0A1B0B2X1_9MUSC